MNAKCTNHPLASFTETLRLSGAQDRVGKRVYVLAAGFEHPGTRGAFDSVQGKPGWEAIVMEGGHDLMLDNPAAVAELLASLA
jgi:hypothetical protein